MLFVFASAVSASNETSVLTNEMDSIDEELAVEPTDEISTSNDEDILTENTNPIKTSIKSDDTNVIKGKEFSVKLTDSASNPIANKTVQFTFNNVKTSKVTDAKGIAKLKINVTPGTYTVKYSFSAKGYASSQNSTKILVISTVYPILKASNYTAYAGLQNLYSVTLTVGGIPLANRNVVLKVAGKTYTKRTDSQGKATINLDLAKGTYILSYYYAGEKNIKSVSGTAKVTVKQGIPTKIAKYYSTTYMNKKAGYFKIKLTDSRGNVLKSKKVTFRLNGKNYNKKTNSKGIATIKIKLKFGSYKLRVTSPKTSVYKKSTKTFKISVSSAKVANGGMWLFGMDMKKVNLAQLQKNGFKHVFLNFKALELYGKSGVEKWVKSAKAKGIKVHIWMQVFYNGHWIRPVSNGKINYNIINSRVNEALNYAKIKGISGIHFDYVRFPGDAGKYSNSVNAVNYFVKKSSTEIHKVNKNLIVSAAIMPEPSALKSAYAQDVRTMGKYFDALVPMVYKGNYHAGAKWIKSVTSVLKKQSSKAKIWTGLQSYRSDANVAKIPAKELANDAKAAIQGGANGIILFRFGLFNFINFKGL